MFQISVEKSASVDVRGKLSNLPSVMKTFAKILHCTTSLQKQKHRMAFKKGYLDHQSKTFLDFMINEFTSPQRYMRIREEGYDCSLYERLLISFKRPWLDKRISRQKNDSNLSIFVWGLRQISESYSL